MSEAIQRMSLIGQKVRVTRGPHAGLIREIVVEDDARVCLENLNGKRPGARAWEFREWLFNHSDYDFL